jgi:hypothetical protein
MAAKHVTVHYLVGGPGSGERVRYNRTFDVVEGGEME